MGTDQVEFHLQPESHTQKQLLYAFCLALVALLLLRDVGGVNLTKWVFVSLSALAFITLNMRNTAVWLCFIIPLMTGLPNTYLFAAGLIIYVVKNIDRLVIKNYILVLVAIFLLELASFMYGYFRMTDYIGFLAPLLLISLIIFSDQDDWDYEKMGLFFVFGAVGAGLSIAWQFIQVNGMDTLIASGVRLGDTNVLLVTEGMRVSFDPNSFGVLSAVAICVVLVLLRRNTYSKIILAALMVFIIFIGSLTLSRLFAILIGIIILVYVITSTRSLRRFLAGMAVITITALAVYGLINNYSPSLIESYASRFAVTDVTAGRAGITAEYFQVLEQHPERLLLGVGLQKYPKKYELNFTSHNGTQEVLITWGVAGLILVSLFIFLIFKYGRRETAKEDWDILYLLPLITILVGVQTLPFFYAGNAEMYLLPAYAAMRLVKYEGRLIR